MSAPMLHTITTNIYGTNVPATVTAVAPAIPVDATVAAPVVVSPADVESIIEQHWG